MEEKIQRWRSGLGTDIATDTTELFQGVKEPNDDDFMSSVTLNDYNRVVVGSVSFAWLSESLKKEMSLRWGSDGIHCIRQEILSHLPTGNISKSRPPNTHEVEFRVAGWFPHHKSSHGSPPADGQELFDSTVLVYSSCEAQAISVKNYLAQVWPLTWRPVHGLLLSVMRGSRNKVFNGELYKQSREAFTYFSSNITRQNRDVSFSRASCPALQSFWSCANRCRMWGTTGLGASRTWR